MKRLLVFFFLITLSFCTKEDNSALENQLASLRAQNTTLLAELNTLKSQTSQIPQLQASLDAALANYNNSLTTIEQLEADIENIRSSFYDLSWSIKHFFEEINPSNNNSSFYWTDLIDENNENRGSYMFEFGLSSIPTGVQYYWGENSFVNPIFNVYRWNGLCWVRINELSLTYGGTTTIESVYNYGNIKTLSVWNSYISAQSLGLVSNNTSPSHLMRIEFAFLPDETDNFSVRLYLWDNSNAEMILSVPFTDEVSSYDYNTAISQICPD